MSAIDRILTIEQGATWSHAFTAYDTDGSAIDLTGYSVRMQIRDRPWGALLATPTVAITTAASGIVTASLTAAETAALWWTVGHYDLEAEAADGTVLRLYSGEARLSPEVTLD